MRKVYKFELLPDDRTYDIHQGAALLSVGMSFYGTKGSRPTVWMLCDPEAPKVRRGIVVVGTGHPLPDEIDALAFVGTFQVVEGGPPLVFHVFDAGERVE
jgi:hypothetical protein